MRGGSAAAAAAAMAAATNKFFKQQAHQHQSTIEGNTSTIVSPPSPLFATHSSAREKSNENDKNASVLRAGTTTPPSSMESCVGDESTYPTKATPSEANGSISNDVESNCSTANSNE